MTDTCAIVVKLKVKPERFEAYREALLEVIEAMSHEPTFRNTILHISQNDPNMFVLYETWAESRENFLANHMTKPYRESYERKVIEWLAEPREIHFLDIGKEFYSDSFKATLST